MPELSSTIVIDAALPAVAAAVRELGVLRRTAAGAAPGRARSGAGRSGVLGSAWPDGRLLAAGDEVLLRVRTVPGLRLAVRLRVGPVALDHTQATVVAGRLSRWVHTSVLTPTAAGTRLTDSIEWDGAPLRVLGALVGRRVARAAVRRYLGQVRARAEELAAAPAVVAAAVCRDDRVLAQQRARPAATAGRWELPGGQVEPGESARDALVRECREELAADIVAGGQLGPDVPLPGGRVLRVYQACLADPGQHPVPVEHAALRWVGAAELAELDWLDADRAVLPDLDRILRPVSATCAE